MTVRIVSNAVNALISGADDKVKQLVQQMLSYEVETGDWKGTSTMFNWSKNSFPAGFAKPVAANLNKSGIKCVHIRKDKAPALGKPNPAVNP
ncbi:ATP-dependent helicase, partial [Escherichia coli]